MAVTVTPDLKPETALDNLLNNRDVLTAIFDFLQVTSDMKSEERSETRKALIAAAKSCNAFSEPALDVLWHTLPSMLPLLRLLPSFVSYEGVHVRFLSIFWHFYVDFDNLNPDNQRD
ncbi:hypothetical protein BJ165DRAFT_1488635 [Panaeolus papilionaceus]|nr:hypothetical protein BJ165DRAFT_1488635 [Panaeolus papilionaceus]